MYGDEWSERQIKKCEHSEAGFKKRKIKSETCYKFAAHSGDSPHFASAFF